MFLSQLHLFHHPSQGHQHPLQQLGGVDVGTRNVVWYQHAVLGNKVVECHPVDESCTCTRLTTLPHHTPHHTSHHTTSSHTHTLTSLHKVNSLKDGHLLDLLRDKFSIKLSRSLFRIRLQRQRALNTHTHTHTHTG